MSQSGAIEPRPRHAVQWTVVFVSLGAVALWMIVGNRWNLYDNPVASRIALAYFFIMSAAPYWMLYDCWQHDRKLTRKMWFFLVPGGFIWYYCEVYRPRLRDKNHKST